MQTSKPVSRWILAGACLLAGWTAEAQQRAGPFAIFEGHASLLSDAADRSILGSTFGYGGKGGYRWPSWGVFGQIEHNMWLSSELDATVTSGVLNIGAGFEYLYFEGRARTSVALGPSVLLFETLLDPAGTVGFFLDFRPIGIRWTVHENVVLTLDPLSATIVAPVLDAIPIILVQYRTVFAVEGFF